jgi:hypothetical protein
MVEDLKKQGAEYKEDSHSLNENLRVQLNETREMINKMRENKDKEFRKLREKYDDDSRKMSEKQ